MDQINIAADDIVVAISPSGGTLTSAIWCGTPFLRSHPAANPLDITKVGSFPLVPFGGRVAGNRFEFGGQTYRLDANTAWDPLYLHGDAWLSPWRIEGRAATQASLVLDHAATAGAPYAYRARQHFAVGPARFDLALSVENTGPLPMPFGLGHHPFFPLTPKASLALDGGVPAPIPFGPVDAGFAGWGGRATIAWPERHLALHLEADPVFSRYVLYVPDNSFDTSYNRDYFCFEPMTHGLDAQHASGLGGLVVLAPGEILAAGLHFRLEPLA